jgi:hypothetical protein
VAEGDGLLNRYTESNPYPGFESPSLRSFCWNPQFLVRLAVLSGSISKAGECGAAAANSFYLENLFAICQFFRQQLVRDGLNG